MATTTSTPATITTWKLDPAHSHAEFKVKHMMISNVKGSFTGLSGTLTENTTDATLSIVEASIDVATVNTGDAQRDAHLKSADFFDAEKYPTMTFKSTRSSPTETAATRSPATSPSTARPASRPSWSKGRALPAKTPGATPASVFRPPPKSTARTSA